MKIYYFCMYSTVGYRYYYHIMSKPNFMLMLFKSKKREDYDNFS